MQEELNVKPKQQASQKKVLLENEMKKDTKLDEADKIDAMVFLRLRLKISMPHLQQ